ncbi:exosome non-catalytic core subunit rrp46 [Exophiala xenobiotica]|nr:exosome non-catalytic core subunit rrp46 [Exophiala xenobiotica]
MASTTMVEPPQAVLHSLVNADGSATYSAPNHGYKIVAGVNYPVEVPYRSDEIPESTFIEVNLRPHNGVSMVKERHVEELIKRTLETIILADETPRTMLQITLQVVSVETDESLPGGIKGGGQAFNASVLGCLDAAVPMRTVAGAVLVGIGSDRHFMVSPGVVARKKCASLHVFGFDRDGKILLMESEGKFGMGDWKEAEQLARLAVLGSSHKTNVNKQNGDVAMNGSDTGGSPAICVLDVVRKAMENRVIKDEAWRQES